jgi:hypothetical protein
MCWLPFLISLLPAGKLVSTMDRTNWEYGETPLKLLFPGVVLEGFTCHWYAGLPHFHGAAVIRPHANAWWLRRMKLFRK